MPDPGRSCAGSSQQSCLSLDAWNVIGLLHVRKLVNPGGADNRPARFMQTMRPTYFMPMERPLFA
jgi:hypothetical protein